MSSSKERVRQVTRSAAKNESPVKNSAIKRTKEEEGKSIERQGLPAPRGKRNYFDSMSSITKSKLGELLLTVAEEEVKIERHR